LLRHADQLIEPTVAAGEFPVTSALPFGCRRGVARRAGVSPNRGDDHDLVSEDRHDGARKDVTMATSQHNEPPMHLDRKLLLGGAVLVGVAGVIGATGMVLVGVAFASGARQWARRELDQPPSETAKGMTKRFMAAGSAGSKAWRGEARPPAGEN
jgi:hypothetical protein